MRSIKSFIRCAVNRIKETVSSVSRKVAVAVGTFTFAVADAMAGSKGAAGLFQDAKRRPGCKKDHHADHRRLCRVHRAVRSVAVILQIIIVSPNKQER